MSKIGIILNNIGTPKSASRRDVAIYLDEFLMDPDVIPLPVVLRALLVKGLIVPFRSRSSSKKYQAIWMNEGSPLVVYTERLQKKLQQELGPQYSVKIGMRYGSHSLKTALKELEQEGIQKAIFVPLYPQFAEATTGSAVRYLKSLNSSIKFTDLKPFYNQSFFIEPSVQLLQNALGKMKYDHILFSYHGLPKAQDNGYSQQCLETSQRIAHKLNLATESFSTSFQSRLGPSKWIGPATTEEIERLVQSEKKKILIACPSFVTDCLETLEEIGIELKNHFQQLGGEHLELVSCLNDNDLWVRELAKELRSIKSL